MGGDLGLFAGEITSSASTPSALSLSVGALGDSNGIAHPVAVAKSQHGDREPARQVDLVVEGSSQRPSCAAVDMRAASARGSVRPSRKHAVEHVRRHRITSASRRAPRALRARANGRGPEAPVRRRPAPAVAAGGRTDETWAAAAAGRGRAQPSGAARPRRRGDAARRSRCPRARVFDRCDDAADDLAAGRILRQHAVERSRSHGRVDVVEERDRACPAHRPRPPLPRGARLASGEEASSPASAAAAAAAFESPAAASWTSARTRTSGSGCSEAWRNAPAPRAIRRREAGRDRGARPARRPTRAGHEAPRRPRRPRSRRR